MRSILTITTILGIGPFVASCSTATTTVTQIFKIEMLGVPETPTVAEGTEDPRYLNFTLIGVTFSDKDGTVTTLYDGTDAVEAKIVNRGQIVYSKDVASLSGNSYTSATVTFNPTVSGGSKSNSDDVSFTLTNPTATMATAFKIEEGKGSVFVLKVKWKNTAAEGTITEPALSLAPEGS